MEIEKKRRLEQADPKARRYLIQNGLGVSHQGEDLHQKHNPVGTFARKGTFTDDRPMHRRDVVGRHVSAKSRWRWIVGAVCMCAMLFGGDFIQEELVGYLRQQQYAASAPQAADTPLWSRWLGELSVARSTVEAAEAKGLDSAGTVFRDCDECPQMVVLPSGSFIMGSPDDEEGRDIDESPQHIVTIGYRLAVGVYEVTFDEWEACVSAGGCGGYVPVSGFGRGERPVINVDWNDAQSYVSWLSKRTGEKYRLLSESEWEYAARAGTTSRFSWGDEIGSNRANCRGCGGRWDRGITAPVGWYPANAWGLHDMHGNVSEYVQDCWNDHYLRAPADGSAWESGRCDHRVTRGGSWKYGWKWLRSADRDNQWLKTVGGDNFAQVRFVGFRVARTVTP